MYVCIYVCMYCIGSRGQIQYLYTRSYPFLRLTNRFVFWTIINVIGFGVVSGYLKNLSGALPGTSLAIYLMSIVNINSLAFHGIGPLPCPENHVLLSYSARSYRGHRNVHFWFFLSLKISQIQIKIDLLYCSVSV